MKVRLLLLAAMLPFFATAQYGYDRHLMNYFPYFNLGLPQSGDIDGDGDIDIVATLDFAGELLWFENIDGLGRFSTRKILNTEGDDFSNIQMEDFDLDGDLDIVTILDIEEIVIFRNDGAGNFSSPEILLENFAPTLRSVRAVDLDSDGDKDLVFCDPFATDFFWLENNSANANFSNELKLIWDMQPGVVQAYDFGDIDNDGDVDVVAAKVEETGPPNGPVGKIQYYRNQGNGVFDSLKTVRKIDPPAQASVTFTGMQLIDLNEDGGLDVAILSEHDSRLYWYENNFESWLPIPWDEHVVGIAKGPGLFLEDMDNDGDRDFIFTRSAGGFEKECYIFEYDNSSFFWEDYMVMESKGIVAIGGIADFDGDGNRDILTRGDNGSISWFKNFGNNLYGGKHIVVPGLSGTLIAEGLDVDHDDKMDVIFASQSGDEIWYYPGLNGTGIFDEPEQLFESEDIRDFHTNDINQDGILDLVYCSAEGGFLAWREGLTTTAHFGPEKIIANSTLISSPRTVKSPDINGDGLPDILAASWTDSKIAWYRNEGDETFQVTPIISFEMPWANSVDVADFDNDGDLDILATAKQDGEVAIFENINGLGTFGQKTVIAIVDEVTEAITGDLDDDGNIDVLINDEDRGIFYLRGTSEFDGFEAIDTIAHFFNGPKDLELDDVDNDGDLDVLFAGEYQGIGWIENLGNAQFMAPSEINNNDNINTIALSDLDGDEDLDLIYTAGDIVQLGYYANIFGEPNATTTQSIDTKMAKIYPNPFHQTFAIEILKEASINNSLLQIFTIDGKLIATQKITEKQVQINNIVTKGLLFYQLKDVTTGELMQSGKLLGY